MLSYITLLCATVILSVWKGDRSERLGGFTLTGMIFMQFALRAILPRTYETVDWAAVSTDVFGLVAFALIAHFNRRIWPFIAAALQLTAVIGNVVREMTTEVDALVYFFFKIFPTLCVVILLLVVTIVTIVRRHRVQAQPA